MASMEDVRGFQPSSRRARLVSLTGAPAAMSTHPESAGLINK